MLKQSGTNAANAADTSEEEGIPVINTEELKLRSSKVLEIFITHFRHRDFSTLKSVIQLLLKPGGLRSHPCKPAH